MVKMVLDKCTEPSLGVLRKVVVCKEGNGEGFVGFGCGEVAEGES